MGRNETSITADQAAGILGVGRNQVYRLVRDGALQRVSGTTGMRTLLYAEEVQALADTRGVGTSLAELQKSLITERAARRALERRLDRVERMLCLHAPVVGYDEPEVLDLVERVRDALQEPPTETLEVLDWCAIFRSVHEELFHLIRVYTDNPEPWAPLLALAERMYKDGCRGNHDKDLEGAYTELSLARRSLRQAAFFYITQSCNRAHANSVIPEAETDVVRRVNQHVRY